MEPHFWTSEVDRTTANCMALSGVGTVKVDGDLQKVGGTAESSGEPGKLVLGREEHEDPNIGSFWAEVANVTWLENL